MTTVLVDWLGRAGIAQCTDAWARVVGSRDKMVVTRAGRELACWWPGAEVVPEGRHPLQTHLRLVRMAARLITERRPEAVVLANYLLPWAERIVTRAAGRVGARCIIVVHDHRPHSAKAGTTAGLRALLASCDQVVTHSTYVAERVAANAGSTPVLTLPHPAPLALMEAAGDDHRPPWPGAFSQGALVAAHFGVLHRSYKGTAVLTDLARAGVPGWRFAVLGVGAPDLGRADCFTADRFLAPPELAAAVRGSDVTLLPYRHATQSGAVVLAQALGSVVVSTAVGGIPEQVADGHTGLLLAPAAQAGAWRAALERLRDASERQALAANARAEVARSQAVFEAGVGAVLDRRPGAPAASRAAPVGPSGPGTSSDRGQTEAGARRA